MTISEILGNEELRRHEFPVAREKIFLAHAGDCPLPRRVAHAITDYARLAATGDQETVVWPAVVDNWRKLAARLLNAQPDEMAFVGPTSLAERGVQVRLINTRELGVIRPIDVMGQVDEQTRLVALASCHFVSGVRLDLPAIGGFLRERGILFCVDGIQTVGAFPTSAEHIDFLAADAHKWLLGPCAAGMMYVRKELQEHLTPPVYGWHNVRCPNFVAQEQIVLRTGAHRFEAGSHNLLGLIGLHAAMEMLMEIGIENIAAELLRKRAFLIPALQAKGYQVLAANAPASTASGIVTFFRADADMPGLHQRLTDAGIITSLRMDRPGKRYIRLSPHFYNTDAELHRLLELV